MTEQKTMSVRLPAEQHEDLEHVADIDEMPIAESVRVAISEYVERRVNDPEFQLRLKRAMERNRHALDRLART